jgi:tetraacyldisaccharide 4'-kinase
MNQKLEKYLLKVVRGHKQGFVAKVVLLICTLLANIYYLGIKTRSKFYNWGIKRSEELPCTVISVGNITVGGTGKTPVTQLLAREFKERGLKVAILNRGYKADYEDEIGLVSDGEKIFMTPEEAGDEAFMMAQSLPEVPVIIGSDRVITGRYAYENFDTDILLLDDGFQHWPLARDIDVVVVDATNPFANGRLIPRGTLREPLSSLGRADIFFLTKVDQVSRGKINDICAKLNDHNPMALIFETAHRPTYLRTLGEKIDLDSELDLTDKRVMAVSGIGNPQSFEQTLRDLGADLVDQFRFQDHHKYQDEEVIDIFSKAVEQNVELIVTTEKDAVSMSPELVDKIKGQAIDFKVLGITVDVLTEEVRFKKLLSKMEGKGWKVRK